MEPERARRFIKLLSFPNRARRSSHAGQPGTGALSRSRTTYKFNKNAKVARVDYNISPNMNFFFRWADDAQQEQQGIGIFGSTPYPVYPAVPREARRQLVLEPGQRDLAAAPPTNSSSPTTT